jgi:hypothetical protein
MTAPERFADSQIPLAPRAPSIHDRVVAGPEDDRDCRGRSFSGESRGGEARRGDDRDAAVDQVGHQSLHPVVLAFKPVIFDRDVASLDAARFTQALPECRSVPDRRVGRPGDSQRQAGQRHRTDRECCPPPRGRWRRSRDQADNGDDAGRRESSRAGAAPERPPFESITGEGDWMDQVLVLDGPYIKDGFIQVTDKPGLGIELNPDIVRAHLSPGETWWG